MPDPEKNNHWNRLVDAAREAGVNSNEETKKASSSFVSSVVAMQKGLWVFARTILWRRWSLFAALLAIAVYLSFFFLMKSGSSAVKTSPAPVETLPPPPESLP